MKKLYVLLAAFWLIGVIVFPGSPKLKSPVNDAKYKCRQYSIPSLVPGKIRTTPVAAKDGAGMSSLRQ